MSYTIKNIFGNKFDVTVMNTKLDKYMIRNIICYNHSNNKQRVRFKYSRIKFTKYYLKYYISCIFGK